MMSKWCLYRLKQPMWEIYMTLTKGKWYFGWFEFKDIAYGFHRDYYDGWHIALNTGILNVYVNW